MRVLRSRAVALCACQALSLGLILFAFEDTNPGGETGNARNQDSAQQTGKKSDEQEGDGDAEAWPGGEQGQNRGRPDHRAVRGATPVRRGWSARRDRGGAQVRRR